MPVVPRVLEEVICVTPAMCPNCRSRGVATEDAITSGLAPGRVAATVMVAKSTCGRDATGSAWKAIAPASVIAMTMRMVATGRLMKMAERFMAVPPPDEDSRTYAFEYERSVAQAG